MSEFFTNLWFNYHSQILFLLIATHITFVAVTLYLHRSMAHAAVKFHPIVSHFFRLWLWLTTGMVTKEWVAIHRKHHSAVDTDDDPHSPHSTGNTIISILICGVAKYVKASRDKKMIESLSHNTPNDWVETELYSRYPAGGVVIMLFIDFFLFGYSGLVVWAIQMAWIPFWAAGVINGLGHYFGYQNYHDTDPDRQRLTSRGAPVKKQIMYSTNIIPLGIWIGGEELHNNHHAFPTSAKFSTKWYEFDIGWLYIRILRILGLCELRSDKKLDYKTKL